MAVSFSLLDPNHITMNIEGFLEADLCGIRAAVGN
jgi:hypothetical protein